VYGLEVGEPFRVDSRSCDEEVSLVWSKEFALLNQYLEKTL